MTLFGWFSSPAGRAHRVRTILPRPNPFRFERTVTIEARIADWAGLHSMTDWVLINSPTPEMARLAHQWAEQLQAIMEEECPD